MGNYLSADTYTASRGDRLADEDAQYIHTRFRRYPGAVHIDTGLNTGVHADMNLVELAPYPARGWAPRVSSAIRRAPDGS
jgi:hypothetical protein